jgi:murein DD-endopeptidase MepM/ murein hydrolase activator NlpD
MIGNIKTQIITQPYKGEGHRGVDLRSWDFKKNKLLPVVAPQEMYIFRLGIDSYGNDFIVARTLKGIFLKLIHIDYDKSFQMGQFFLAGDFLGYTQIKGNSKAHHLHFETHKNGQHFDPCLYFDKYGISWRLKK